MRKHHINHNHNHNHNHSKHKRRVTTTTQTRTHTKRNTHTHTNIYTHTQQNPIQKNVMCNVILRRKNSVQTSRENNHRSKIRNERKQSPQKASKHEWNLKALAVTITLVNEHHHETRTQLWKTTAFRDSAVLLTITKQIEKRQQRLKIYHPRTNIQKHKKTPTVTTKLTKN